MISALPSTVYQNVIAPPLQWVSDTIQKIAEKCFGYLLRIIIFQLGEMKVRGAYTIMRIYQRLSSDPREERPFDRDRLQESKKVLLQFGGIEATVDSQQEKIQCMTFTSERFFGAFAELGAVPLSVSYEGRIRKVLINPPPEAGKFYFPIIDIQRIDGTRVKGALLPESAPGDGPKPMIFHCHSPGRSMCMDRRFLGLHLAAGYDVAIWDPRGTVDSTGSPSEGGYYLDAEAVFAHVLRLGYSSDRIYVSGFCEGVAAAAHLKKKFHKEGVHFIASNTYTSMKEVLEGYGWLGRMGVRYGLKALQDPQTGVEEDGFDNEAKFRSLPQSNGSFVLLDTDTDTMMPAGTVQRLAAAIGAAGPVRRITRKHPDPTANGHMQPPYEDPIVWREYVKAVI